MKNFEYRIVVAYLVIGGAWIQFSDSILNSLVREKEILSQLQTYKGWFYVVLTSVMFFIFLRNHLKKLRRTEKELEYHQKELQELVRMKTENLDKLVDELKIKNKALSKTLSDLRNTQMHLMQAEKMASVGVLSAGVAHEINNPLNYILAGYTGLLKHLDDEFLQNDEVQKLLGSIKIGVDKSAGVVSKLNQFSEKTISYDGQVNVKELVLNCVSVFRAQINRSIKIVTRVNADNLDVQGNSGQLHQAIMNILMNAGMAVKDEGEIQVSIHEKQHFLEIQISDNGEGIPNEYLSKVFDPFFTTRNPGEGSGLGLSIAYSIIRGHKGKIEIMSEFSKGTTVLIEIPGKASIYGT